MLFHDRHDAGRQLATRLEFLRGEDAVVLGLPRGGVPVAFEVARALGTPLEVIVVRKLGLPFQPELAFGAIGEDGVRVVNDRIVRHAGLDDEAIAAIEQQERRELSRRIDVLRRRRPQTPLAGRTAVIVDDGIATGATARAACQVARAHGAQRVVLAVPVAARDALAALDTAADQIVCLDAWNWFFAIGQAYHDFRHITDDEVTAFLADATADRPLPEKTPIDSPLRDEQVRVNAGGADLAGRLIIPENPCGIVIFVHGSGSSRHSPRNRYVATELNKAGLGTLLFDLLTSDEEIHRANVFDIELLTRRLIAITRWIAGQQDAAGLPVGYFGASTGAAAALRAAADPRVDIAAVVSRGGRPDLADTALGDVRSPVLLIVGGDDPTVLELNRYAQRSMSCETRLAVVPGATHLFAEPGALETVAELAREWFTEHLSAALPHLSGR